MTDDDHRHGTYAGYQVHVRARVIPCDQCRAANAQHHRELRANRTDRVRYADLDCEHGQYSTYTNYGCRCADCRAASAAYARAVRRHNREMKNAPES